MVGGGRNSRVALGVVVFLAVISFASVSYVQLGAMTGVLAICTTAPEWWASTYFLMGLSVPIVAIWAGIHVAKRPQRAEPNAYEICTNRVKSPEKLNDAGQD